MWMVELILVPIRNKSKTRIYLIEEFLGRRGPAAMMSDLEQCNGAQFATCDHVVFDGPFSVSGQENSSPAIRNFQNQGVVVMRSVCGNVAVWWRKYAYPRSTDHHRRGRPVEANNANIVGGRMLLHCLPLVCRGFRADP